MIFQSNLSDNRTPAIRINPWYKGVSVDRNPFDRSGMTDDCPNRNICFKRNRGSLVGACSIRNKAAKLHEDPCTEHSEHSNTHATNIAKFMNDENELNAIYSTISSMKLIGLDLVQWQESCLSQQYKEHKEILEKELDIILNCNSARSLEDILNIVMSHRHLLDKRAQHHQILAQQFLSASQYLNLIGQTLMSLKAEQANRNRSELNGSSNSHFNGKADKNVMRMNEHNFLVKNDLKIDRQNIETGFRQNRLKMDSNLQGFISDTEEHISQRVKRVKEITKPQNELLPNKLRGGIDSSVHVSYTGYPLNSINKSIEEKTSLCQDIQFVRNSLDEVSTSEDESNHFETATTKPQELPDILREYSENKGNDISVENASNEGPVNSSSFDALPVIYDPKKFIKALDTKKLNIASAANSSYHCNMCKSNVTPQWRYLNMIRFCNACYMRIKRHLGNMKKIPAFVSS